MARYRILFLLLLLAVVASTAGCPKNTGSPPGDVKSYLKVRQDFIAALEELNPQWGKQYHLAVIPPFAEVYMPGMPLLKDSFEPLTDSCLVPQKDMPSKEVSDPPVSRIDRKFDAQAGLPSLMSEAIKQVVDLGASVKLHREAQFSYSELSELNPRRDKLEDALRNPECLKVIAGRDIILIRGLVSGKETIFSTSSFGADAKVQFLKDNAIKVTYESTGGYEVKDSRSRGRFWIVGEWRVDVPGLTAGASAAERRARIEDFLRVETQKTSLSVKESPASSETLRALEATTSRAR